MRKHLEILLVEDNPGDAVLVREAFREARAGHSFSVARTGEEALTYLRNRLAADRVPLPDLILLDLNLPGLTGTEVLQRIREDPALMHIPVVVLSASSDKADVLRSYELRANSYITKPLDLPSYQAMARNVVGFWATMVTLPPPARA